MTQGKVETQSPDGLDHFPLIVILPSEVTDVEEYVAEYMNGIQENLASEGYLFRTKCQCVNAVAYEAAIIHANETVAPIEKMMDSFLRQHMPEVREAIEADEYPVIETWGTRLNERFMAENEELVNRHKEAFEGYMYAHPLHQKPDSHCPICEGEGELIFYSSMANWRRWRIGGIFDGTVTFTPRLDATVKGDELVYNFGSEYETLERNLSLAGTALEQGIKRNHPVLCGGLVTPNKDWVQPFMRFALPSNPKKMVGGGDVNTMAQWTELVMQMYSEYSDHRIVMVDIIANFEGKH